MLGQVAEGYGVDDLRVGGEVELVVETLYTDETGDRPIWRWKPVDRAGRGGRPVSPARRRRPRGRHAPLGQVGPQLRRVRRARRPRGARRRRRRLGDVDLVVGGETVRNGYAGYVAGATFAQALGWNGARVATSYAACATGAQAIDTARARILAGLCDVALVVGADTTPKGFLAPNAGERWDDPDWLRFRLLGMTNPAYFALYARRRMDLYGATAGGLRAGEGQERPARAGQPERPLPQGGRRRGRAGIAVVADPLHLLDICATSDGAAAVVLTSMEYARRHGLAEPVRVRGDLDGDADLPEHGDRHAELSSTDSLAAVDRRRERDLQGVDRARGVRGGRHRPRGRRAWPRSTTCPPRSSSTGSRTSGSASAARPRSCCAPATPPSAAGSRSTRRGGLACFGEAVPAQALAQVCEVTWQLRGQAEGRQVEGARVGITANQGLFGHGSSVLLSV